MVIAAATLAGGAAVAIATADPGTAGATGSCTKTAALAYSTGTYAGDKGAIVVANADGSSHRTLIQAATPFLSPNGELVAVTKIGSSGGLGIFNLCGARVGTYFSSKDQVSSITWSSDSSTLAVVDSADPNNKPFDAHLEVINVAAKKATSVATGFLGAFGGPSFAPGTIDQLVYPNSVKTGANTELYQVTVGGSPTRLTSSGENQFPLWAKQGVLFQHDDSKGAETIDLLANGHTSTVVKTYAWPVAISGTHLLAENAACGVVWPVTVSLTAKKVIHSYPTSFAPYGISASGNTIMFAGATPTNDCGGPRSRIETAPFSGGTPKFLAYGTDPSWAASQAVGIQP